MKVIRKYKDGISSLEYGKIYDVIKKDNISIGGWIKRPSYLIENDNGYKVWYSARNFKEVNGENKIKNKSEFTILKKEVLGKIECDEHNGGNILILTDKDLDTKTPSKLFNINDFNSSSRKAFIKASIVVYNGEIIKSRYTINDKKHKEDLYEIKSLLSKARHPYVKYSDDEKQMKLEASDSMFKAIDELLIKLENKLNGC